MKVKFVRYAAIGLMSFLAIIGCDDTTGSLGMDMLPSADGLSAHMKTYNVLTQSVAAKNIYSKTSTGYIGSFTDPEFGKYETSFLTELNCTDRYKFPVEVYKVTETDEQGNPTKATGVMVEDKITKVNLVVYYSSWFGDSLNACRMTAYELNDKWLDDRMNPEKYRYTNSIDVDKYIDKENEMGRKAYSAYDLSVPDSVRNATDSYGNKTFYPNVTFSLDADKYGTKILKLNREYHQGKNNAFDSAESFINYKAQTNSEPDVAAKGIRGIYLKSDFGDGTIIYVDRVDLQMQFKFYYTDEKTGVKLKKKVKDDKGEAGTDSIGYGWTTMFASTKEIIQANSFASGFDEKIEEKIKDNSCTYIKSPAGIFTQATIPYESIYNDLKNDTLNAVKLTFTNYHQKEDYPFSMQSPNNVLLLRKYDYDKFFSENQLPDNITSYTAAHNSLGTNQYTFSNLARLITTGINEKNAAKQKAKEEAGNTWNETAWEENWKNNPETKDWDKVYLIPVKPTYDASSSGTMISIQHDLQPAYAKLKGGATEPLEMQVTYTRFQKDEKQQ